jgi:hypothetical protein
MKRLLTISKGNFLSQLSGSILLLLAVLMFAFAFWTTGGLRAQTTPTASPDMNGDSDPKKCTICHVPPGNPGNAHTLTIGCSAVQAHLRNHPGDCLGPCPCQPTPKTNP